MALKNQVVRRLVEKLAVHITATYKYLTNPQLESLLLLHTGGRIPGAGMTCWIFCTKSTDGSRSSAVVKPRSGRSTTAR